MKRISIEGTDLSISPIGLGAAVAGLTWDGAEADRIFDAYLDMGGNFIDTAHVYSDWVPPEIARSERAIGDWLRRGGTGGGKRNRFILATKGGHPDLNVPSEERGSRMTAADMEADLNASLTKLGVDCVDIYFYHRDDPAQSVGALIDVMEDFVRRGKIRYYACSNWRTERMEEAGAYCRAKGYRGFVANQALLNIGLKYARPGGDGTMTSFDDAMLAYHRRTPGNLAMPYMGMCGGFFHRYLTLGAESVQKARYYTEGNIQVATQIAALMERYGATVGQVLLGYFGALDCPCVPLFGPKNYEQVVDAMKTPSIEFRAEDFVL